MFGFQNVLRKEKKMLRKKNVKKNDFIMFSFNVKIKTNIIKILYILKLFNFYIKKRKNKWNGFKVVYKIIYLF